MQQEKKEKQMEDQHRGAVHREMAVNPGDVRATREGDVGASSSSGETVGALDRILTSIEKREILSALERANGQRTLAARLLGISRSRLYRRMEALGINPRTAGSREDR